MNWVYLKFGVFISWVILVFFVCLNNHDAHVRVIKASSKEVVTNRGVFGLEKPFKFESGKCYSLSLSGGRGRKSVKGVYTEIECYQSLNKWTEYDNGLNY